MIIVWSKKNSNGLFATLNRNSIILNRQCAKLLDEYQYVKLGLEVEKNQIIIAAISNNDVSSGKYDIEQDLIKLAVTSSYTRINATSFFRFIDLQLASDSIKVNVTYNESRKYLIIDLERRA